MLKLWLIRLMPFMARWESNAPAACCGMCGPCLTATATGLSLEVIGARKSGDGPGDAEAAGGGVAQPSRRPSA
jgi:hypothetical protein